MSAEHYHFTSLPDPVPGLLEEGATVWFFDGRTNPSKAEIVTVLEEHLYFEVRSKFGRKKVSEHSCFTSKEKLINEVRMHIAMMQSWLERGGESKDLN